MSDIKDLFGNQEQSYKILSARDITELTSSHDAESYGYIEASQKEEDRFFPTVDYTKPKNFVRYGSAQKYYEDSIKRIYRMYPYDGSYKEKIAWHNSSSYLDNYIFDNEYPRTNGYLDFIPVDSAGLFVSSSGPPTPFLYKELQASQYISVKGGPHAASVLDVDDEIKSQTPDYKSLSGQSAFTSPLANIYDPDKRRASNFAMDGAQGNTVECWISPEALSSSVGVASSQGFINTALFDLWNGDSTAITEPGSASYGRFLIEKNVNPGTGTPIDGANFHVTYMSGTAGAERIPMFLTGATLGVMTASWNHVAISVKNSGNTLDVKSYLNGILIETFLTGTSISTVTGALNAYIGAYRHFPNNFVKNAAAVVGVTDFDGWGSISGSMDEFRFWKVARNSREIGRNWFTQVYGGANSDDANTTLGVYYKFNEGITENNSFDQIALDYSGRISDGTIQNYSSSMRQTGSAMVLAGAAASEFKDPILYSFQPQVSTLITNKKLLGDEYDTTNNASIINTFPDWIVDEDQEAGGGNLHNLVQIVAQYFDNLQVLMDFLNHLKDIEYTKYSEITAIPYADGGSIYNNTAFNIDPPYSASYSGKPLPFSKNLLSAVGMNVPEIFTDAVALEALSSRDDYRIFQQKIFEVKNQIYQNIYNNLNYIFKSKGTEKAFRNLIRCYGIDEEIVKINLYGDNITHKIKDNYRSVAAKKTYIDFNHTNRFSSVVYQMTSSISPYNTNTVYSYIPTGSTPNIILSGGYGLTFETEVLFPKKDAPCGGIDYQPYDFLTASLYGAHTPIIAAPGAAGQGNTTWHTSQTTDFQVYAIKDVLESNPNYDGDTYFQLTSSWLGINLTSSLFDSVYNNQKWNFAVRIKPTKYPWIGNSVTGALSSSYEVSFYGANANLDVISNEFALSASVSNAVGNTWTSGERRLYLGPHRTNFTGTVLARSDVKISSTRAWMDYLTNDEIKAHARDAENHGVLHPYRNAFVFQTGSTPYYIPRSELLILEWDFSQITSSDGSGEFQFQDISSGSLPGTYASWITDNRYGGLRDVVRNQFAGKGDLFPATDANVAQREYIYSAQQIPPEVIESSDMVNILERDDVVFTKESLPIDYYIAVEKSMYQTISQEMLKMFATIQDFNNLVGDPVNRYRGYYKNMEKLKSLFYENIENSPDLDKYVDFYKWIDSSIAMFLEQLFPASANYAEDMRTLVESHVLERNAYRNKFPTLEMKAEDPETSILGINELTYNWKYGHAPSGTVGVPSPEDQNCLWWNQRAERDGPILSQSVGSVNTDRSKILDIITTENSGSYLKRIQGSTYVFRKLSRPYKEGVSFSKQLHGGVNYPPNSKTQEFYRPIFAQYGAGWRMMITASSESQVQEEQFAGFVAPGAECLDDLSLLRKQKYNMGVIVTTTDTAPWDNVYKDDLVLPYSLYKMNPQNPDNVGTTGGDLMLIGGEGEIQVVVPHDDSYGPANEVPMQGPFTEKWVGGSPYRHAPQSLLDPDPEWESGRPEAWRFVSTEGQIFVIAGPQDDPGSPPDSTRARSTYYRDQIAKRPVCIKNILQTTASQETHLSGTIQDGFIGHGPIGNYSQQYELVQTSGRRINNKAWAEYASSTTNPTAGEVISTLAGSLLASPETPYFMEGEPFVSGNYNFQLRDLDLAVYKTVFAERFSAPGSFDVLSRGYLDPFAEEYSVYNALPFRNWTVRGPRFQKLTGSLPRVGMSASIWSTGSLGLQSLLTRHCGWGGYDYELQTSGAYQKTNRNRRRMMELSGVSLTSYVTGSQFDNWWVQHPIPRSDFQYSWITASILGGNPTDASAGNLILGYFPADGMVSSSGGGWESAVNFVSASAVTAGGNIVDFVGLNTLIYDPLTSSLNILSSSDNNYINSSIASLTSPQDINALFLHRNGPYGWPSWKQTRVGETAVPRHHKKNNIFSISVRNVASVNKFAVFPLLAAGPNTMASRGKTSYKDLEGANHKGKNLGIVSIENYTEPLITSKYFPMRHTLDTINEKILSELVIDHTYTNNLATFANPQLDTKIQFAAGLRKDIRTLKKAPEQVYDKLIDTYVKGTLPANSNPIKGFKNLVYKENVYPKAQNTYLVKTRGRTNYTEEPSVIQGSSYTQPLGEQRTFWKDSLADRLRTGGVARNALDYTILSTDVLGPNIGSSSAHGYPRAEGLSIWPLDVGSRTLTDNTSYSKLSGSNQGQLSVNNTTVTLAELQSGSALFPNSGIPTASFNYEYYNDIHCKMPHNTPSSFARAANDHIYTPFIPDWETAKLARKNPWFDSYEDYAQDIRCFGKEYTVLPEFKISDQIDYYLSQQNFQAKNNKFLSLEGGALSQSAASETSPFDSGFFNEYCHSDFLKHFEVVQAEHEGIAQATQMTIKCHGIKKLLPYNGFYPMLRTVQLGNLFSQSFAPFLTGSSMYSASAVTERLASVMQPFFNPGILYNTIKSGLAVDWMALTGSDSPNYATTLATYIQSGSISSSFRFPFESVVDPGAYLPTPSDTGSFEESNAAIYYLDTSDWAAGPTPVAPSGSHVTGAYGVWEGKQKLNYTMAMQNFLGESSRFFLQGSKYKNILSGPESKIKPFVSGVTYYMDLVCYKTDDLVMYEGPQQLSGNSFGVLPITAPRQARGIHYGPILQVATPVGPAAGADIGTYRFDPAMASYTPPYFYGQSVSTFAFKPHEAAILMEGETLTLTPDFDLRDILGYLEDQGTVHYNKFDNDISGLLLDSLDNRTGFIRGTEADAFKPGAAAARTQMTNKASFNLFDLVELPSVDFNPMTGQPVSTNTNTKKYWSISPKFECPVLNFSGTETTVTGVFPDASNGIDYSTRGMWRGYGDMPGDGTGIYFEVKESFPTDTYAGKIAAVHKTIGGKPYNLPLSASLLQHLGFKSGLKQRIGEISETREIFEAVVAIPFKEINNKRVFFPILAVDDPVMKSVLSKRVVQSILGNDEPLSPEIYTPGPSIINMVETMQKYVFPPKLDFITNESVTPFCMYIFEFGHELDKQDLADIWQGVMPKISLVAEEQTATISHFLTNNELLGAGPITKDLRWMVFKVKQKAEKSYYNVTISTADDDKFKFDFKVGESRTGTNVPNYSYNWPYDFFSLVELAKVDAAIQIGGNIPITPPDITATADSPLPLGAVKPPAMGGPSIAIPEGIILVDDSGQGNPGYPAGQVPPGLDITKIGNIVAGQPSPMMAGATSNMMMQGIKTSTKNMGQYGDPTKQGNF